MADPRKSEQLGHELVEPRRVLREMNYAGMEMGGLRRQPHDLVAFELAVMLMGVDTLHLQGLDEARPRAFVLDDKVSVCPINFPLSPQRRCRRHEFGILEPAADKIDEVDFAATVLDMPD